MKIEYNNLVSKLIPESSYERTFLATLQTTFSTMAPGAEYTSAYKKYKYSGGKQGWSGKVSLIRTGGLLPTGMLPRLLDVTQARGVNITLIDNRGISVQSVKTHSLNLRDYQQEVVQKLLTHQYEWAGWWPRGVIELATGGGKTEVAAAITQAFNLQTLFIVHRKDLVKQTVDRFNKYGIPATRFGAGIKQLSKITVATVQTICSVLKSDPDVLIEHLKNVQIVFFDEAHLLAANLVKGNQFVQVSSLMPNAFIRLGLTATPFMKDGYSNMLLEGETGPSLYKASNMELIEKNYLTPPTIKIQEVGLPFHVLHGSWNEQYTEGIVLNKKRNLLVKEWMQKIPKPALCMTNQVAHANILYNEGSRAGLKIAVLTGESELRERVITVNALRSGVFDMIICTTIFDEGIDIPELRGIILAGGGKSPIKSRQRIGRGLRLDDNKQEVVVVDFNDNHGSILKKHSLQRQRTYREEQFNVEFIKDSQA